MLMAPLGARLTMRVDCTRLRQLLGYFLLCAAPLVPLKAYLLSRAGPADGEAQGGDGAAPGAPAGAAAPGGSTGSNAGVQGTAAKGWRHSAAELAANFALPEPATAAALAATGAVAGVASGLLGIGVRAAAAGCAVPGTANTLC